MGSVDDGEEALERNRIDDVRSAWELLDRHPHSHFRKTFLVRSGLRFCQSHLTACYSYSYRDCSVLLSPSTQNVRKKYFDKEAELDYYHD